VSVPEARSLGLYASFIRPETETQRLERGRRAYQAILERFIAKWKRADRDDPASCWVWMADTNDPPKQYGRFKVLGRLALAHRVAYELWVGPIADGMTLDHLCNRPECVNPFHLEVVTNSENVSRARRQRRSA
jgi:hypothetical protein